MAAELENWIRNVAQELDLGQLSSLHALAGGSINQVFVGHFEHGKKVLKFNASPPKDFFEAEKDGLHALSQTTSEVMVPSTNYTDHHGLVMEYVEPATFNDQIQERLGRSLAAIHKTSSGDFGWHRDNYIGILPQLNEPKASWWEFFCECRLMPMVRRTTTLMSSEDQKRFTYLYSVGEKWFPKEPPSLLHGDLWAGNAFAGKQGQNSLPVIIDPAVYYGHREMDIAMTRMFGGFNQSFYQAYHEVYPLEKGWEERLALCNLYPLLVHLELFGLSYLKEIRTVLSNFGL
ncbi:fructosamine kinase family protein [Sanyastnella coralliicola]|uniref:fructosamine kinase family protein n=1 Tax=Sanyastnella coralliicola TaxID=3069118 RepID=UPI0027BAFFC5|nr:fructosamine kinase family protein [Longitalea sp. SCSIO 12813]